MNAGVRFLRALFFGAALSLPCAASDITVTVLTKDGKPVPDAVVYLNEPDLVSPKALPMKTMDQQHKTFVPHVLAVSAGTLVDFPNTDSVNHYVYSFSDVKKFQFKLFKGDLEKHQMVFDKPGLITIGCNIHDYMLGYIFVSPSSYFGVSDGTGKVHLNVPDRNNFTVSVWHESSDENLDSLDHKITVNNIPSSVEIRFAKPLKPLRKMSHDGDDY